MTFNELLNSDILKDVQDNPTSLINIDINDIKELFQLDKEIHVLDIKVNIDGQRMELLMKQVKEGTKSNLDFSSALVYFFFPESHPLLMSEIKTFSEWIESVPNEFMMKWGMATQPSLELRGIVLLQ